MTDTITIELPRADRIDGKHVYAATNARGHWMIWMQDDRPPIEKLLHVLQEVGRDSAEEWVQWWDEHIDYWRSEAVDPAEYRQLVEAMRKAHRFIESKTSGEESTQAGMALLNALDRNRQRSLKVSGGSDTEWIIPNIAANPTRSDEGLRLAAERLVASVENAMSYGDSLDESAGFEKALENLRTALSQSPDNPPTETPGLREAAQKFVDRWAHPDKLTADQLHHLVASLEAALSQTPEAEQKEIPDERICPGCKGTGVRDANHGMCRACNGYGKFQDPPPTAPEESEPVSESVDCSRGGDELIFEAEAGVKIVQRFDGEPNEYELVMPSGNRNIWFTDREAAIYCAQVVGSCWLEAEACGAMEEREAAANPSQTPSDLDQKQTIQVDGWQLVDSAPIDGTMIIVTDGQSVDVRRAIDLHRSPWITHWMPLPNPPANPQGETDRTEGEK